MEQIQALRERITERGEREGSAAMRELFAEIAHTESDCSSAQKYGDLGSFGRGAMQNAEGLRRRLLLPGGGGDERSRRHGLRDPHHSSSGMSGILGLLRALRERRYPLRMHMFRFVVELWNSSLSEISVNINNLGVFTGVNSYSFIGHTFGNNKRVATALDIAGSSILWKPFFKSIIDLHIILLILQVPRTCGEEI